MKGWKNKVLIFTIKYMLHFYPVSKTRVLLEIRRWKDLCDSYLNHVELKLANIQVFNMSINKEFGIKVVI